MTVDTGQYNSLVTMFLKKHSFPEIHQVNLRTLTERHVITFRKQLINLLYEPTWIILVKLSEINMTPLINLSKTQSLITG